MLDIRPSSIAPQKRDRLGNFVDRSSSYDSSDSIVDNHIDLYTCSSSNVALMSPLKINSINGATFTSELSIKVHADANSKAFTYQTTATVIFIDRTIEIDPVTVSHLRDEQGDFIRVSFNDDVIAQLFTHIDSVDSKAYTDEQQRLFKYLQLLKENKRSFNALVTMLTNLMSSETIESLGVELREYINHEWQYFYSQITPEQLVEFNKKILLHFKEKLKRFCNDYLNPHSSLSNEQTLFPEPLAFLKDALDKISSKLQNVFSTLLTLDRDTRHALLNENLNILKLFVSYFAEHELTDIPEREQLQKIFGLLKQAEPSFKKRRTAESEKTESPLGQFRIALQKFFDSLSDERRKELLIRFDTALENFDSKYQRSFKEKLQGSLQEYFIKTLLEECLARPVVASEALKMPKNLLDIFHVLLLPLPLPMANTNFYSACVQRKSDVGEAFFEYLHGKLENLLSTRLNLPESPGDESFLSSTPSPK